MKKAIFITVLLMAMLYMQGCKTEKEIPVQETPVISITQPDEIPAEGGDIKIPYKIANPTDGIQLTAISSQDWIKITDISENEISATAGKNTSTIVRNSDITLSYEGAENLIVSVVQRAPEDFFTLTEESRGYDNIKFNIKPLNDEIRYFVSLTETEKFNRESAASEYLETVRKYAEQKGTGLEEAIAELSYTGEQSIETKGLYPATGYTVFAYGINEKGEPVTNLSCMEIPTEEVPSGEKTGCTFEISATDISDNSAIITFTPSDPTIYYYNEVFDKEGYEAVSKNWNAYIYNYMTSRIIEPLTLEQTIMAICNRGTYKVSAKGLEQLSEYYACAVGVDMNALIITDVKVMSFKTEEYIPVDYTIGFTTEEITSRGAKITAAAKDARAVYYWDVMTEDVYLSLGKDEEKIGKYFMEMMDEKRKAEYGEYADYFPLADYIYSKCTSGATPEPYTFTALSSSTTYYPYGFWINTEDLTSEKFSDTSFGEPFTTLEKVVSEATAEATLWLTDGDDWKRLNPAAFAYFGGQAILGARLTHSEDAVNWYSNIYEASQLSYSDEELIASLLQQGYRNRENYYLSYPVAWGGDYVILTVAVDKDGNAGELHKLQFKADKSLAEPLEELPEY